MDIPDYCASLVSEGIPVSCLCFHLWLLILWCGIERREASGKERRRGGGTPRESTLSLHLFQDSTHSSNTLAVGGQKAFKKPFNKDWCILHLFMRGFLDHTIDQYILCAGKTFASTNLVTCIHMLSTLQLCMSGVLKINHFLCLQNLFQYAKHACHLSTKN